MTVAEMRLALLVSDKTGIGNERAYYEVPKKAFQVSIDVDSLGWVNDNLGHLGGDAMLRAVGQALGGEAADVYHLHGDEFAAQFDGEEAGRDAMERVRERLSGAVLEFVTPAGTRIQKFGIGISYGIDRTFSGADDKLYADKAARTAGGERVERGREPAGVYREAAGGDGIGERDAARSEIADVVSAGTYNGRVMGIVDGVVTQRVSRDGRTVRHDLSRLQGRVEVGDVLDVRYQGGRGEIKDAGLVAGIAR